MQVNRKRYTAFMVVSVLGERAGRERKVRENMGRVGSGW
jgi:hypothetical protein